MKKKKEMKLFKCELSDRTELPWCDVLLILAEDNEEAKTIYKSHFVIVSDCVVVTEIEMKKGMIYRVHQN